MRLLKAEVSEHFLWASGDTVKFKNPAGQDLHQLIFWLFYFSKRTYLALPWATYHRGDSMSYVNPAIKEKFESLSVDLKNNILSRNVRLNTLQDLIKVLEEIVAEEE